VKAAVLRERNAPLAIDVRERGPMWIEPDRDFFLLFRPLSKLFGPIDGPLQIGRQRGGFVGRLAMRERRRLAIEDDRQHQR